MEQGEAKRVYWFGFGGRRAALGMSGAFYCDCRKRNHFIPDCRELRLQRSSEKKEIHRKPNLLPYACFFPQYNAGLPSRITANTQIFEVSVALF